MSRFEKGKHKKVEELYKVKHGLCPYCSLKTVLSPCPNCGNSIGRGIGQDERL